MTQYDARLFIEPPLQQICFYPFSFPRFCEYSHDVVMFYWCILENLVFVGGKFHIFIGATWVVGMVEVWLSVSLAGGARGNVLPQRG